MVARAQADVSPAPDGCVMVGIGSILAGPRTSGALFWGAERAQHSGRPLCLVHAWNPWAMGPTNVAVSLYGCAPGPQRIRDDRDLAVRRLAGAARQVRRAFPDLPVRTRLLEGQAANCLAALSVGADSLVLGPSGAGRYRITGRRMCVAVAAQARAPIVRVRPGRGPRGQVVAISSRLDDLAAILPLSLRLAAQQGLPAQAVILVRPRWPRRELHVPHLEVALFDLLAASRSVHPSVVVSGAVALETSTLQHLVFTGDASGVILACPRGHTATARARRREVSRIVAQVPGSAVLIPTGP